MSRSTSEDGGDILLAPGLEHGAAHADHHDRHNQARPAPVRSATPTPIYYPS